MFCRIDGVREKEYCVLLTILGRRAFYYLEGFIYDLFLRNYSDDI